MHNSDMAICEKEQMDLDDTHMVPVVVDETYYTHTGRSFL